MSSAAGVGRTSTPTVIAMAVVGVVVVAAIVFVFMQGAGANEPGLVARIHASDGTVREMPLDADDELEVQTELGRNVVVVESGEVYVREADCDNQDCVHQGKVGAPGRQIICLPHKLWIEVLRSGDAGGEMDVNATADEGLDVTSR